VGKVKKKKSAEEALRESEEKYKSLLAASPDAIVSADLKGRFTYVSPRALEMYGAKDASEMIGRRAFNFVVKKDVGKALKVLKQTISGKKKINFEMTFKRKDGTTFIGEVNTALVRDPSGKPVGVTGVIRDVDESVTARRRLLESEQKFKTFAEQSPNMIFINRGGRVVYANKKCIEIMGYKREEFYSPEFDFLSLIAPEYLDMIKKHFAKHMKGEEVPSYEYALVTKKGKKIDTIITTKLIDYEGEKVILGMVTDITDRKIGEIALRESEENFRALAEKSPNMIGIVNASKNKVMYANKKAEEMLGYTKDELISPDFKFFDVLTPETRGEAMENFKRTLEGEELPSHELSFITKEGKKVDTLVSSKAIDFMGERALLGIVTDITARKEAEEALQRAHDELEERVEERTSQLVLLQNINAAMNMGMSLQDVMQITVEGVRDTFDYTACDIFLLDEERKNLILSAISIESSSLRKIERLIGHKAIGFKIPLFEGSHFTRVIKEKKPHITEDTTMVFEDFTDNKRLKRLAPAVAKIAGFKSAMEVPLIVEDEVIGAIGVSSKKSITDEETGQIRRFASQIALTIKKAQLERALRESEEKHRSIVENIIDVYYRGDLKGKLVMASPSAARLFGYASVEEMIGRDIAEDFYYNPQDREPLLAELKKNGKVMNFEVLLKRKDGSAITVETTSYFVYDEKGKPTAVEGLFRDVTERKRAEEEMKRRLMKYSLDDGNVYLVKESASDLSVRAFNDLLNIRYDGLIISRDPEEKFEKIANSGFKFLWLAEKGGKKASSPALKEIKKAVKNLKRKNTVLIDRLDYLISKNGFKKTLSFIQDLREVAYLSGFVAILSIDPSTIERRELRLLEKETREIELHTKTRLPEDLLEILRFIYEQNTSGIKPSYSDIGKEAGVSKPTARKRIKNLIFKGYMMESKKGLYKVVELTDKGRNLFFS
jgi:PAS domain S-box-containing protein